MDKQYTPYNKVTQKKTNDHLRKSKHEARINLHIKYNSISSSTGQILNWYSSFDYSITWNDLQDESLILTIPN